MYISHDIYHMYPCLYGYALHDSVSAISRQMNKATWQENSELYSLVSMRGLERLCFTDCRQQIQTDTRGNIM